MLYYCESWPTYAFYHFKYNQSESIDTERETFFFFVHFPMRQQTRLVGKNKVLFRAAIEIWTTASEKAIKLVSFNNMRQQLTSV